MKDDRTNIDFNQEVEVSTIIKNINRKKTIKKIVIFIIIAIVIFFTITGVLYKSYKSKYLPDLSKQENLTNTNNFGFASMLYDNMLEYAENESTMYMMSIYTYPNTYLGWLLHQEEELHVNYGADSDTFDVWYNILTDRKDLGLPSGNIILLYNVITGNKIIDVDNKIIYTQNSNFYNENISYFQSMCSTNMAKIFDKLDYMLVYEDYTVSDTHPTYIVGKVLNDNKVDVQIKMDGEYIRTVRNEYGNKKFSETILFYGEISDGNLPISNEQLSSYNIVN